MKTIRNTLCLLSLVLCTAPVIAEEQTNLKTATQEEIASCGTKLALARALQHVNLGLCPITAPLATVLISRATYQTLSWLPKAVAFSCALFNGLFIYSTVALGPFFLEQYVKSTYDTTFDAKSRELIREYANAKDYRPYAELGVVIAAITGLVVLSVQ